MDYTFLLFLVIALLCFHGAWVIVKLRDIDKRTTHSDRSLRANESVADSIAVGSAPMTSDQRRLVRDGEDNFEALIRHLEGGFPTDDPPDDRDLRHAPSTMQAMPRSASRVGMA